MSKDVVITLRLTEDLKKKLDERVKKHGVTRAKYMRLLILEDIEEESAHNNLRLGAL